MQSGVPIFIFVLGLILGSFANVLVYRRGTGRSLNGRSHCMSCSRTLGVFDLVPVFSWVFLRGRCRGCSAKISWQYPLVELSMGLGFLAAYEAAVREASPPILFFFFAISTAVVFLWIAISAYDFRHMAIPDSWSYTAAALAFAYAVLTTDLPFTAIIAGPLVALPLFFLWLVSSGRWLGAGDPKLALSVGWLLGASNGYLSLYLAVIMGAATGLIWIFSSSRTGQKKVTIKAAMPFGPFIVLGAIIVLGTGFTFAEFMASTAYLYGI